jgi:hypothetical protein
MLEPSTVVKQSPRQVSCNLNEEVAILDLDQALYFGLEGVGAHIWAELERPRSVAEICRSIAESFDVGEADLEADVLKFLQQLQEVGLIETIPPEGRA